MAVKDKPVSRVMVVSVAKCGYVTMLIVASTLPVPKRQNTFSERVIKHNGLFYMWI